MQIFLDLTFIVVCGADSIWYKQSSRVWVHASLFEPVCLEAITCLSEFGNKSTQTRIVYKTTLVCTGFDLIATLN